MGKAANQVKAFKSKVQKRFRFIARTAALAVNNRAQVTVFEGGRMRVDTGFLVGSNAGAVGERPRGPVRGEKDRKYPIGTYTGIPVAVALLQWEPNEQTPFYVGWTANYARFREANDGFLRGALEMWGVEVKKAVAQARAGGI